MKMSPVVRLLIFVSLLALSACTEYLPVRLISQQQIDQWVKNRQYGKAVTVLERRNRQYPSATNKQRLARVRRIAERYARQTSTKALRLQQEGNWAASLRLLDQALRNYPQSKTLNKALREIRRRQTVASDKLQTKLLLARGKWLLASIPVQQSLARINPDDTRIQQALRTALRDRTWIASELTRRGITAMRNRNYALAEKCLNLADRLHFSAQTTMALARLASIRYRIQQRRERARKKREDRRHRRRIARRIRQAQLALKRGRLLRARKIVTALKNHGAWHPRLYSLDTAIESAIRSRITELTRTGDDLYSHGNIKGAREAWREALRFDPHNATLISRVDRATRVLRHLNELRRKQQQKRTNQSPSA